MSILYCKNRIAKSDFPNNVHKSYYCEQNMTENTSYNFFLTKVKFQLITLILYYIFPIVIKRNITLTFAISVYV